MKPGMSLIAQASTISSAPYLWRSKRMVGEGDGMAPMLSPRGGFKAIEGADGGTGGPSGGSVAANGAGNQ